MFVSRAAIVFWCAVALVRSTCFAQQLEPAPPGAAQATAFNLASLEQLALARNPTLAQAGAQVQLSEGRAYQAGLLPNPQIGYSSQEINANGTAGEFQGMFVEQEIVTGHKLQLSRAKYTQEAKEAEIQTTAQRYRVMYSVRVAFYTALVQMHRMELQQQLARNAGEAAKTMEELVNAGQANRADLLRAQVALDRAQTNLRVAERRYQGSREELAAVVGAPEIAIGKLEGTLDFGKNEALDRSLALGNLLSCSPELQFAEAEVARDQIALQRERAEPTPNITVKAESGYDFDTGNPVAGVDVGLRIPLFDRNQGSVTQAQAELSRASAEVRRVELMLRNRFAQVFTDYEAAMLSAATFREDVIPKGAETYSLYQESFQNQRAAWPQVLEAQREYYEMIEVYLDHVLEARRAEALIANYLLDNGLQQPPEPSPMGHRDATPKPR